MAQPEAPRRRDFTPRQSLAQLPVPPISYRSRGLRSWGCATPPPHGSQRRRLPLICRVVTIDMPTSMLVLSVDTTPRGQLSTWPWQAGIAHIFNNYADAALRARYVDDDGQRLRGRIYQLSIRPAVADGGQGRYSPRECPGRFLTTRLAAPAARSRSGHCRLEASAATYLCSPYICCGEQLPENSCCDNGRVKRALT